MWIQLELGDLLLGDQQLRNLLWVAPPDLSGQAVFLGAAVLKGGLQHDRHHQAAVVLEIDFIKIALLLEQRLFLIAQALEHFLIGLTILLSDLQLIVFVVKILQLRKRIHALGERLVAFLKQPFGFLVAFVFAGGLFLVGIARVDGIMMDGLDGNVRVVGGVKPAAPKPVEILSAGVFHGAEEIRRSRPLEGPAAGVLLEGVVELLPAEHALAQNV